ncbi:MAG TPA: flagellar basal body rod protein FlgB [Rhizomicrobium sp.]|nr:flagellar basal body rod protein FlgB [Rhizomicrobium sp.]
MNLSDLPLFNVLSERMSWLTQRQSVLSQNVANADTPGYDALDLKPVDFSDLLKESAQQGGFGSGLTVTDPHHIAITSANAGSFETQPSDEADANLSGNTVSNEEEMMKVSDTQAQYQAATNIYAKAVGMMRTAIDRSGP